MKTIEQVDSFYELFDWNIKQTLYVSESLSMVEMHLDRINELETDKTPYIQAIITQGDDAQTSVYGHTIEEVIGKINDFHTLTETEYDMMTEVDRRYAVRCGWFTRESVDEIVQKYVDLDD